MNRTTYNNGGKTFLQAFSEKPATPWMKLMTFMICAAAAAVKLTFYYSMMGADSHMDILVAVTLCFLIVFYNAFRNKVIPLILYFLLTLLMVADAVYYSFFNRYLSITIADAVGLVGDVQDSVWEVLKPSVFLLFLDCILISVIVYVMHRKETSSSGMQTSAGNLGRAEKLFFRAGSEEGRIKCLAAGLLALFCLLVVTPKTDSFLNAVVNQEFFTYHLRDVSGIQQQSEASEMDSIGEILAVTGEYDSEKDGPEFGIAQGKNLIVIQVEAMQNFIIGAEYKGQEITPNLNRLLQNDTFYFDTYYQQLGSGNTSDAEFATNNSFYGSMKTYTYEIYKDNYFRGLPVLLKEKGYTALAFHAYDKDFWSREKAYPGQGFDDFYSAEDFERGDMLGMGLADKDMFLQTAEILSQQTDPFYAFVVTLSSHHPFDISGNLDISEDTESTFENYIQSMNYVDSAIGAFIEELKEKGLYENTVIAIYGDHFGLNPKDEEVNEEISAFLGVDYWYEEAMNIPLIIHVPGSGVSRTVSVAGGQTDFLPTIAYLMGFDTLDTIYFGHNLLTVEDNFVPIRAYVQRGSFVTGDIMFQMSANRIFSDGRAVNICTGEEIDDLEELKSLYVKSVQLTNTSDYYLEQDILRKVYLQGESLEACLGVEKQLEEEEAQLQSDLGTVIIDATNGEGEGDGVYCLENLESLYQKGYRCIKVRMLYTVDGHLVVMDKRSDLSRYFREPLDSYTYEQFSQAKADPASQEVTAMTVEDLAQWMRSHPDVTIVMELGNEVLGESSIEVHSIYMIRGISENYGDLKDKVVYFLNTGEEVERANLEGYTNIIFNVAGQGYTEEQLMDFTSLYKVRAAVMAEAELTEYLQVWAQWESPIYVFHNEPYEEETLEKKNLAGVVIL